MRGIGSHGSNGKFSINNDKVFVKMINFRCKFIDLRLADEDNKGSTIFFTKIVSSERDKEIE